MFKLQFRKKRPTEQYQFQSEPYRDTQNQFFDTGFPGQSNTAPFTTEASDIQIEQNDGLCTFCGGEIKGHHLAVTLRGEEHCIHPSCAVSGFALLVNGIGLLMGWLRDKARKKR